MKSCRNKYGLTLVEVLIVIAIIAILTTIVIGVAGRVQDRANEYLIKNTLVICTTSLRQFGEYTYIYEGQYSDLRYPIDCNDFESEEIKSALQTALGGQSVTIFAVPEYSGCEMMYFFLNRVPSSREILEKIDSSLIKSEDSSGIIRTMKIGSRDYTLLRIVDPWGKTLRYDYYDENLTYYSPQREKSKKNFPVITSAGPDGIFDTSDDITSR